MYIKRQAEYLSLNCIRQKFKASILRLYTKKNTWSLKEEKNSKNKVIKSTRKVLVNSKSLIKIFMLVRCFDDSRESKQLIIRITDSELNFGECFDDKRTTTCCLYDSGAKRRVNAFLLISLNKLNMFEGENCVNEVLNICKAEIVVY